MKKIEYENFAAIVLSCLGIGLGFIGVSLGFAVFVSKFMLENYLDSTSFKALFLILAWLSFAITFSGLTTIGASSFLGRKICRKLNIDE